MVLAGLLQGSEGPPAIAMVLEMALAGDVDAQLAAGLIYAEGRGVETDLVQAFFWLSRAIDQGSEEAADLRELISAEMSDEDYDRAVHLIEAVQVSGFLQQGAPEDGEHMH